MHVRIVLASLAALAIACPAAATPEQKQASADRLICKKRSDDTGSRLNVKRVCATKAQWAELEAMTQETRRNIEKIQRERAH